MTLCHPFLLLSGGQSIALSLGLLCVSGKKGAKKKDRLRRYFVLRGQTLDYYKSPADSVESRGGPDVRAPRLMITATASPGPGVDSRHRVS